jgi:AraC-like DNA-binding protein
MMHSARLACLRGRVRVYEYPVDPSTPPVVLARVGHGVMSDHGQVHNFPALWYARATGVAYVVAMGALISPADVESTDDGIAVFFDPAALGEGGASPWLAWRAHPLLCLFLHERRGGLLRLEVPAERRASFEATVESMRSELAGRRPGHREATLAHLTLLLIDLARLADDVVGELRRSGEPLLAEVFATIDARYHEVLSLGDVAREVAVSPGYLTTMVRRRTGRTVQEWIADRRMGEARRLLTDTHLPIAEIAQRVGLPDPTYFTRLFRRTHKVSPRDWRKQPAAGLPTG